jgi:hypothetical protein
MISSVILSGIYITKPRPTCSPNISSPAQPVAVNRLVCLKIRKITCAGLHKLGSVSASFSDVYQRQDTLYGIAF